MTVRLWGVEKTKSKRPYHGPKRKANETCTDG
jgi:hypothetical protein